MNQIQIKTIQKIINEVKEKGDEAIKKYTEIFDKISLNRFLVNKKEIEEAYKQIDAKTFKAIKEAGKNIKKFAELQLKQFVNFEYKYDGITLGQRINPIEKIGVYVPGGRFALPSSALMGIIPAKVAKVGQVIVCSPKIKPITIVAANWAGADMIFKIGGAQAIAAMAFGTETVPKVDKIVGPGNIFVTLAKKEIYGDCGIDFLAGPSEILVIADNSANAKFLAADLLAQREHDLLAKAVLVSDSDTLLKRVKEETVLLAKKLALQGTAKQLLQSHNFIKVPKIEKAIKLANEMAPEHLVLAVKNSKKYLTRLNNYGSLFLGEYSAVAFGDYCSGANHILPTQKNSKFTGGLSVKDFLKIQTYQEITFKGAQVLSKTAMRLALEEGLKGHEESIKLRIKRHKNG